MGKLTKLNNQLIWTEVSLPRVGGLHHLYDVVRNVLKDIQLQR